MVFKVLKQYADFKGRARRKEYWMFGLFYIIFYIAFMILDNMLGTTFNLDKQGIVSFGWLESIYYLATFVPALAVSFRRLHDIGKSGLWNLLVFVPFVGWIILIVWVCQDSQAGENKWGVNPKK